jgi:glycosyltransferase involved in cell wall biosynthesis
MRSEHRNAAIASVERAGTLVSVVVLTFNEEVNLPDCLASLDGLRCELFVVDSGSTDRTVEIAHRRQATVVSHAFHDYASQRNWAMDHLQFSNRWVLHLDADERLTTGLVEELNQVLGQAPRDVDGFLLRKRTVFMGRWIRHGGHYPSYHLRLFRVDRGRCESRRYDQHFVLDGTIRRLHHDYVDIVTPGLLTWTVRHGRWAAMEASELLNPSSGPGQVVPNVLGNPIERRRWWRSRYARGPLFARALAYWSYRYVLRLGFLDGREGLIFHFLQGFWFRFLVDAMICEQRLADCSRRS